MGTIMASLTQIQQKENAAWYRALTLTERLVLLHASPTIQVVSDAQRPQIVTQFSRRWQEQNVFKNPEIFAERLHFDTMTEEEFTTLLNHPIETYYEHISAQPSWLKDLLTAISNAQVSRDTVTKTPSILSAADVFQALITPDLDRLTRAIEELLSNTAAHPFDPAIVLPLLVANVKAQIQRVAIRPLILDLHIARLQGNLEGSSGQERFASFLHRLKDREHLQVFLLEYPVLARYLVTIIHNWADYSLEILQHLCTDWDALCALFTPDADPGVLVGIQSEVGDKHCRGKSVHILYFSSGLRLVYKPRSLQVDSHFQELLSWINTRGIAQQLRTIKILSREHYGWCEFVSSQSCTTEVEVAHFYERQGSYLALLYMLDATDVHFENLIAVGEHPILVDLESLFHLRLHEMRGDGLMHSVQRIGLLPMRKQMDKKGQAIDISGLGKQNGQLSPIRVQVIREGNTDQVHLEREYTTIHDGEHRPTLNECDVEVQRYTQHIVQGFTQTYRILIAYRNELYNHILPRFANDEVRFIPRATSAYAMYLQSSLHPDCLRDALERDRVLDHLWDAIPALPPLKKLLAAERADLLPGDIPLFHTQPTSRDLITSQGERITDFCTEPAMDFVIRRLQHLGEEDLALQQWIIQASLATVPMDTGEKRTLQLRERAGLVTRLQLLAKACAIGNRLCELATRDEGCVNWLGVTLESEEPGEVHWSVQSAKGKLYDGTPGIVLFLAYLGAVTGNTCYTQLAQSALATVRQQLERQKKPDETFLIGAFSGLASSIYLFSHLATLWQDKTCLHTAEDVLSLIEEQIEQDKNLDIMAGSAGCLISLLSLYAVIPSQRFLSAALHCGNHLLAQARSIAGGLCWQTVSECPPLAGFSHGAAGISYSLVKLALASGEERFMQAAWGGIAYERSLFSQEHQNWPSLMRTDEENITNRMQVNWCHGAPGIGLGRLAIVKHIDDPLVYKEIEAAVKTTITRGFGRNQSLCHGDMGNLETLLVAAQTLNRPYYHEQLARISSMVFDGIERYGWITGVPMGIETPGLMVGLAGIGYQLLRLAEPEHVPSVLLLEPPISH